MKSIKYFFEALIIYLFFLIAKIFGLLISRKIFSFIFRKIGPVIKSSKIVDGNLKNFSNDLSKDRKKEIVSNMWSNYGMTFVEYIFLKDFKKKHSHINIDGEKILEKILLNNKPVIFISGHFANFELMSMEIAKKKINLATIYRPLNNFFLNPFMEYLRRKYVCKNQIKKGRGGVRESIEYIKNQNSIALMVDQRVSEGEKIKFFNKEAYTTTLPGQLALKYNLEIVPVFIERTNENFFKMKVYDPIKSSNFKNKIQISEKLNQVIENMISKNPNQWIWTHDRWK
ncbi:MAG: lipid A biosynthesis acyltransferase [Candidatus Pelagibacter sp.]|nr:lipid A biosynthesis acyltransferase [Candidatus Pelagibacter sp.]